MKLIAELKRRNVFRVAVAYLVAAWLVIQVTGEVAPALGLPEWSSTMVVWLSIVGFPFMLIFAWMYELTPDGLRREEGDTEAGADEVPYSTPGLNMLITALLAVALVFVIVDSYVMRDDVFDDTSAQQSDPVESSAAADTNSIAVLPFTNMSEDEAQDYFSDGLAEELLNLLAKQKGLKVAARTSSFSFRNAQQDIRAIGDALAVATVLEGSVRKSGNRLRITAQLIGVNDGYHLWSETYDRELTDVFAVQDEIAAAIVQALSLHLDLHAPGQQHPGNIEAYDLYLQGRHLSRRAELASSKEALALYRRATEVDPTFAPAWAALGNETLLLRESQFWEGIPEADAIAMAQNSIDRALALSPDLADAHVTQSLLHWDRYRFEQALASAEQAIAINPNLATAHAARARVLEAMGYIGAAWDALGKAIQLDPLDEDHMIRRVRLARGYLDDEHLERATHAYEMALEGQNRDDSAEAIASLELMNAIRRSSEFAMLYRKAHDMGAEIEAAEIKSDVFINEAFTRYPAIRSAPNGKSVKEAIHAIESAERPVIVAGGGARASAAGPDIVELAERLSIPIATSVTG